MSYNVHSEYPRFVYSGDDETLYYFQDEWPPTGTIDGDELTDLGPEAVEINDFDVVSLDGKLYARHAITGIMLLLKEDGTINAEEMSDELVWFSDVDGEETYHTGKNEEIYNALMSSNLATSTHKFDVSDPFFKGAPAEAEAEDELVDYSQEDEEDNGGDDDDIYGVTVDADIRAAPTQVLVSRVVAQHGLDKDSERDRPIYNEQLRSLIEASIKYTDEEQFDRYFTAFDTLLDRAEQRKHPRKVQPSWLIPIVSDRENSTYRGGSAKDEVSALERALTYSRDDEVGAGSNHRVGTATYRNFMTTVTSGRLPQPTADHSIEETVEKPLETLKFNVDRAEGGQCDSSYAATVISKELFEKPESTTQTYKIPAQEYKIQLIIDDNAVERLKRNKKPGVFITLAQRGTDIKDAECVHVEEMDRRVYIVGYVKMPISVTSALKQFEILNKKLKSAAATNLTADFKLPANFYDMASAFTLTSSVADPLEVLVPNVDQIAELHKTHIFRNLSEVAELYRSYGVDPKDITSAVIKKLQFKADQPAYSVAYKPKLLEQFAALDYHRLTDYAWIVKNPLQLASIGSVNIAAKKSRGLLSKDTSYDTITAAVASLAVATSKSTKNAEDREKQFELVAAVVWDSLSLKQKQEVRRLRTGAINVIDPDIFNLGVAASYNGAYPYSYTSRDTDETRVGWLLRAPDFGELYFLQLQRQYNPDDYSALLADVTKAIADLKAEASAVAVVKPAHHHALDGKMLHIVDSDVYVWNGKKYIARDDYIRQQRIARLEIVRSNLVELGRTTDDLSGRLELGKLTLASNIMNSVVARKLETVQPLEQKRGSALYRYIKSLNHKDNIDDRAKFRKVLSGPLVTLNEKNQYILIETKETICCEHELATYALSEADLIEKYGEEDHAGDKLCKYCNAMLEEYQDEFGGFKDGMPNITHAILEVEGGQEVIYDTTSELETMIFYVAKKFSYDNRHTLLSDATLGAIIEAAVEKFESDDYAMKDPTGDPIVALGNSDALKLDAIVAAVGPKLKDISRTVGLTAKMTSIPRDTLTKIYMSLWLSIFVYRLPTILAYTTAELETEYNQYRSSGTNIGSVVEAATTGLLSWFGDVAKKFREGVSAIPEELIPIAMKLLPDNSGGLGLKEYLTQRISEKHDELANGTYFSRYEKAKATLITSGGMVDYEGLVPISNNVIGFVVEPTAVSNGSGQMGKIEAIRVRNMAYASKSINDNHTAYQLLSAKIDIMGLYTGGAAKTFAEYDSFSRANVDEETAESCFVPPSMCMMGQLLTGDAALVQEYYHPASKVAMHKSIAEYGTDTAVTDRTVREVTFAAPSAEDPLDQLLGKLPNVVNASDRSYLLRDTSQLPSEYDQIELVSEGPEASTRMSNVSEWTKKMVLYLLGTPALDAAFDQKLTALKGNYRTKSDVLLRDILSSFGISNDRGIELESFVKEDMDMLERVVARRNDLTFTGIATADIEAIAEFVGVQTSVGSGTTKTPSAERTTNVFLHKSCRYSDAQYKIKNLYRLLGTGLSLCYNATGDESLININLIADTGNKLAKDIRDFIEEKTISSIKDRRDALGAYVQYCESIFNIKTDELIQILAEKRDSTTGDEQTVWTHALSNLNDTFKKLFRMALELELVVHLYKLGVAKEEIPDIKLLPPGGPTSGLNKDVPSIVSAKSATTEKSNLFIDLVKRLTLFAARTYSVTDPLNSTTYEKPMAQREYDIMKKAVMESKKDWSIVKAGLSLEDLEAKIEDEFDENGAPKQKPTVGEGAAAQGDDAEEEEDAYEDVEKE